MRKLFRIGWLYQNCVVSISRVLGSKATKSIISCALILSASQKGSFPCWISPINVYEQDLPSWSHLINKYQVLISETLTVSINIMGSFFFISLASFLKALCGQKSAWMGKGNKQMAEKRYDKFTKLDSITMSSHKQGLLVLCPVKSVMHYIIYRTLNRPTNFIRSNIRKRYIN